MQNWFECKIACDKILENGIQKKVVDPFLVDALSFTEAEKRIIEETKPFASGEITVTDIKRAKISEIFYNETGDRYYSAKIAFITLDENSGSEKKTFSKMIAQASTLKEAINVIETGMKGTMADYVIVSISETALVDVFPYNANKERDLFSGFGASITVKLEPGEEKDALFNDAISILMQNQYASTSLLQRHFSIGYNRAKKLMDQLENAGIVGPMLGNQPRAILLPH